MLVRLALRVPLLALVLWSPPASAATPIRVLILAGSDEPERRAAAPVLKSIFERSGRFDVRICEATTGLGDRTFEGFDLIVDDGGEVNARASQALADAVSSGKGLVATYGAVAGASASSSLSPLAVKPQAASPVVLLDIQLLRPEHPVLAGCPREMLTVGPAAAIHLNGTGVEALAVAGPGKAPVIAIGKHGAGRIVAVGLGRDSSGLHEPEVAHILTRAGEWAATGAVAPEGAPNSSFRAVLITGGHFHDASFYGLFDGIEGLDALPVESSQVFQKDVRDKYDVAIFYDFTRDLDEPARANLRAFVEAGKGVVVLHHALLDFQTWTWWSEGVVGGRYRLQREGSSPSSSVKDDVPMFVSPAGNHPVLRGVVPFLVQDEAYRNMYHSEQATPLLTTDATESDRVVAWVGPCRSARVVAVQLGHGPSAYRHPMYRKLVHNAVRWSARKID